jgi:hypothetical protein
MCQVHCEVGVGGSSLQECPVAAAPFVLQGVNTSHILKGACNCWGYSMLHTSLMQLPTVRKGQGNHAADHL